MRVKIYGSGSIGNHLANASRQMGWSVDLCDVDSAALDRTRNNIYPARYGAWDDEISLHLNDEAPTGGHDLIAVGTPPDHHISVAMTAIAEKPKAILVEKPFCTPDLKGAQELTEAARENGVALFTGYDHVVGEAAQAMAGLLQNRAVGDIQSLDVEFREYWGGIFAAHPWLDGPKDTYLGYWQRGGGALGEHSHALNLWQHFAQQAGAGRVTQVQAMIDYVDDGTVSYDRLCQLNLRTETGLTGRVVQDVVTNPTRKWARVQGTGGYAEWQCGYAPGQDAVTLGPQDKDAELTTYDKTRPTDFILELRHIETALKTDPDASSISGAMGLDTMLVVAAAHKSAQSGKMVSIDYTKGYTQSALYA